MRLGGPVFDKFETPEQWISALRTLGYRAAYCPVGSNVDDATVRAFEDAAKAEGIVIAEVGAWSNPMGPDETARNTALDHCQRQLALADRIGALCCVNIAGSRGTQWDGPDPANLTPETFDLIVETVRKIIDAVKPARTYYALETMPWMYPDSPESYVQLIKAIDRAQFAAHLDPVNLVCSPQRYYGNAALIRECFAAFGSHIKSCHGKDIILRPALTTHLDEIRPGLGGLDYPVYLQEIEKLGTDTPLMLEHLEKPEDYTEAATHVRNAAQKTGIPLSS